MTECLLFFLSKQNGINKLYPAVPAFCDKVHFVVTGTAHTDVSVFNNKSWTESGTTFLLDFLTPVSIHYVTVQMSFSWCSGITCVLLFSLSNNYYSACCLSLVYSLSIFGEENIQSFSHKTRQKNPTYNLHTHVLCCQKLWNLWFTLQNNMHQHSHKQEAIAHQFVKI